MTKTKNFFQLVSSLPIVSDTVSYVTESYNGIKGKNELVGAFLGGVERSVFRATYAAYHITKVAVPYDYLDHVASEELKKAEEKFPIIKKPTKQIWKEFSTSTLSRISGVTAKKKIPNTLSEAVKTRVSCVVKTTVNKVAETTPGKILGKIGHIILDKAEEVIDVVIPEKKHKSKHRTKSEFILERISEICSRAKHNLGEIAKEIAEVKGKHHRHHHKKDLKDMTCAELIEALEHSISNFYHDLRSLQWPEKIYGKGKHLVKMVTTSISQSVVGTVKQILPELEKIKAYAKEKVQIVMKRTEEDGKYYATEIYRECKVVLRDIIETIKKINLRKIPGSLIHAVKFFWREITNEELMFSFTTLEQIPVSAHGKHADKHTHTEDIDIMVGATSSEA